MVADIKARRKWIGGSDNGANFNLSFAGCGFLGIYHVGVASCIKEYAPHLIADQVCGASAGALVASAMITDSCLGDATTYTLQIASLARKRALGPLHPSFNIGRHLREGLDRFLPENAHEIASGRLNISLTRVSDRQNVIVNQFESKEELIQVLICSSFVPFYCGILPPKYRGVRYVDGGLSDNIPILNDNTITVSPFAGESDICPTDISANDMHISLVNTSIQCTTENLYRASYAFFPPHPEILADTCKQGFNDALRFLQKNTLISNMRLLTMNSVMVTDEKNPSHPIDLSDDELDGDFDDESDCDDCEEYQQDEPLSSLPPSVIIALETAIDSVNKGLLAPMYNSRAFSVVSLMTAPAILPVDVAVVLAQRLYEWVPYMPSDMQWFVYELGTVLQEILYFVKHGRHHYSARFSCQLAITEMDVVPTSVEVHGAGSPVSSPFIQRRTTMTATELRHHHHYHGEPHSPRHVLPAARPRRESNAFNGPVHCAEDLRHDLLEDRSHNHFKLNHPLIEDSAAHYSSFDSEDEGEDEGEDQFVNDMGTGENTGETEHLLDDINDVAYGQFENVLEVADNTDSILAFYYAEESNPGVVQVTEIFPLDDPALDFPLEQMRSRASSLASISSVTGRPVRKKSDTIQNRPDSDDGFQTQTSSNTSRRSRWKSELPSSDSDPYLDCLSGGTRSRKYGHMGSRGSRVKIDPSERKLKVAMSESNLFAPTGEARSWKSGLYGQPSRRQSIAK